MKFRRLWILLVFVLATSGLTSAFAKGKTDRKSKDLDFEGEVVEGVSRQSLDSLNQVTEKTLAVQRDHLYPRHKQFTTEREALVRGLAETY